MIPSTDRTDEETVELIREWLQQYGLTIIIGDDEAANQSASLKNLRDGNQERLPLAEIPAYLQERLKETA